MKSDLRKEAEAFVSALNLTRSKGSQKWMVDLLERFAAEREKAAVAEFVERVRQVCDNERQLIGELDDSDAIRLMAEVQKEMFG